MNHTSSPSDQRRRADDPTSLAYMLRLSGPMTISTISFTIMQFVDRLMVSRLGKDALAAVLPAAFVNFIPSGFALGAITSLNTFVSQAFGRGHKHICSSYFWQIVYLGLLYSVLVVALMWPSAPYIFKAMGQPPAVLTQEVIYFRILLYAHILAVINWASNQFYMGIHRPVITMCASLCGQVVNVIANYVLIFGKFGLPRLEIAGAGWGTFIGIAVAAVVNLSIFLGPRINAQFHTRRSLQINLHRMADLLRVGLPAGFGLMVNVALWGVILSSLVGRFGRNALAATSAALSYTSLAVMPIVGISTALTAAVGKSIGSGRKTLAIRQTSICLRIAAIYMTVVGLVFLIFRNALMSFWSTDPAVIEAGSKILICAALYQAFHAARIIYAGALRGAGDTLWLAGVSATGALLVLGLGGTMMILLYPSLGALGPWLAATASIISVGLANRWRFKSNKWMRIDLLRRETMPLPLQNGLEA